MLTMIVAVALGDVLAVAIVLAAIRCLDSIGRHS